jgi:hypothetical protein
LLSLYFSISVPLIVKSVRKASLPWHFLNAAVCIQLNVCAVIKAHKHPPSVFWHPIFELLFVTKLSRKWENIAENSIKHKSDVKHFMAMGKTTPATKIAVCVYERLQLFLFFAVSAKLYARNFMLIQRVLVSIFIIKCFLFFHTLPKFSVSGYNFQGWFLTPKDNSGEVKVVENLNNILKSSH